MKNIKDYLDREEVERILSAASTPSERDYLIMRAIWRTGVRVDGLHHIRPRDIEPHNKVVNIVRAKGGKMRRVPLDAETISLLRDYAITNDINENSPLFPLSKQWIRDLVHRYGLLIGVDNVHPHTFRHSFAINSVWHGVDIRRLQQVLGHENLNTVAVYVQFDDKALHDVYANVPF
ncbi:MAG: tyrosine-type recombinase/integrase [Halobacteriota archaeon]